MQVINNQKEPLKIILNNVLVSMIKLVLVDYITIIFLIVMLWESFDSIINLMIKCKTNARKELLVSKFQHWMKTRRVWKQDIYFFYFFKNMVGEKSNSAGNCCLHLPQTTGGSWSSTFQKFTADGNRILFISSERKGTVIYSAVVSLEGNCQPNIDFL